MLLESKDNLYTHAVIGSGPAGWSALTTLLEQGIKPLLIDIGQTSENKHQFLSPGTKSSSAVAQKTRFGSSHMYSYPSDSHYSFQVKGTIPISSATGGLSTVWGSNIQGFLWPKEFPLHNINFSKSLNSVIAKIPTTGYQDDLETIFRWPEPFKDRTTISKRSKKIINRFKSDHNWVLGEARNSTAGAKTGCTKCGYCLTGCPENVIFSTDSRILEMITTGQIDYLEAQVTSLEKYDTGWKIKLKHFNPLSENVIHSKNVYLGAGAIATAMILSRSELIPSKAELEDTQVLYLPLFSFRDKAENRTSFSLAQLFLETTSGLFSSESLHVSIYEHSESFRERAAIIFPKLAPLLPGFVFRRLMAGIAFLSPQVSGKICIENYSKHTTISLIENPEIQASVKRSIQRLKKPLVKMGLFPINLFTTLGNVGASYHVGNLTSAESQLINHHGMIKDTRNLFIIDGCALPAIPAGPITLGIMANARRITTASLNL